MPNDTRRLPPHPMSEELVLAKLRYFTEVQLWPITSRLDPVSWLRNFRDEERPYAVHILNVFLHLSDPIIDAIFVATIRSLASDVASCATSSGDAHSLWRNFLSSIRVTYVQGENPRPTDSGHLFSRRARLLRIPESRILRPDEALDYITHNPLDPLLFVDDFVGSGSQMERTWMREFTNVESTQGLSFQDVVGPEHYVVYVPIVSTVIGAERLKESCRHLRIFPGHLLDERYSLLSDKSVLWPPNLKGGVSDALYSASVRAGITESESVGWKGFCDLALPISFSHGVPDATLPLVWWDQGDWAPLVRMP